MIYLVDSNVYIHGFRDRDFGERMRDFHSKHLARLMLSAVVMHELLVGAANAKREKVLLSGLIEPFRIRRRLHVPGRETWEAAANVDQRLRKRLSLQSRLRTRSFANDLLIAASAREIGATIVTENRDDFEIIGSALDIRFTEPFP
jgi:tRNA(fMet)-specific endonuclease VapC